MCPKSVIWAVEGVRPFLVQFSLDRSATSGAWYPQTIGVQDIVTVKSRNSVVGPAVGLCIEQESFHSLRPMERRHSPPVYYWLFIGIAAEDRSAIFVQSPKKEIKPTDDPAVCQHRAYTVFAVCRTSLS